MYADKTLHITQIKINVFAFKDMEFIQMFAQFVQPGISFKTTIALLVLSILSTTQQLKDVIALMDI
jgi:hypothetical protein